MDAKRIDLEFLDAANAEVLAELVIDTQTPEALRVQIINKLLDGTEHDNFFRTIFGENLSYGQCPKCEHWNHWLVPEDDLNQMGWVTHDKDDRVPRMTTKADCETWMESCRKKKVII